MKKLILILIVTTMTFSAIAVDEVLKIEKLGEFKPGGEHSLTLNRTGDVYMASLFTSEPVKIKLKKSRPFHYVMTFYQCRQFPGHMPEVIKYEINKPEVGFAAVYFRCKEGYPRRWKERAGEFCAKAEEHMLKTCSLVYDKYGKDIFK